MKLSGKVALITGGSKGIGEAIARRFIKEGARAIVFDVERPNYKAEFYRVDVTSEEQIEEAFRGIKKLDILVNNAGIYFEAYVENTPREKLERIVDINFNGAYLMSKHAIPLIKRSRGSIINISSAIGVTPEPASPAYCSTKAAIIMLTRCMALRYASDGVRVNAILPGPIDTPLLRSAFPSQREIDELGKAIPLGRIGKPGEVASVAAFLASDEAGYVTGGTYAVDGGESIAGPSSK